MFEDIIKPKRKTMKISWKKSVAEEMDKWLKELAKIQPMPENTLSGIFQKTSKKTVNRPYRRKK